MAAISSPPYSPRPRQSGTLDTPQLPEHRRCHCPPTSGQVRGLPAGGGQPADAHRAGGGWATRGCARRAWLQERFPRLRRALTELGPLRRQGGWWGEGEAEAPHSWKHPFGCACIATVRAWAEKSEGKYERRQRTRLECAEQEYQGIDGLQNTKKEKHSRTHRMGHYRWETERGAGGRWRPSLGRPRAMARDARRTASPPRIAPTRGATRGRRGGSGGHTAAAHVARSHLPQCTYIDPRAAGAPVGAAPPPATPAAHLHPPLGARPRLGARRPPVGPAAPPAAGGEDRADEHHLVGAAVGAAIRRHPEHLGHLDDTPAGGGASFPFV